MSFLSPPPMPAAPAAPPPIAPQAPPMMQAQAKSNKKTTPNPTIIGGKQVNAQPLTLMGPGGLGLGGGASQLGA